MSLYRTGIADIDDLLGIFLCEVERRLGDHFAGLYLHGSIALGAFDEQSNDIDYLVMTNGPLVDDEIAALEVMHRSLLVSHPIWAAKLEGSYVPRADLRRYEPGCGPYPCTNEAKFYRAGLGSEWIFNLSLLREQGVVLTGPEPATFIDPVSPDEIREAARNFLSESAEYMRGRLPDAGYPTYAVLTLCRLLYSIANGVVVSKVDAARWAHDHADPRWRCVIAEAVATRRSGTLERIDEVDQMIRTVAHAEP